MLHPRKVNRNNFGLAFGVLKWPVKRAQIPSLNAWMGKLEGPKGAICAHGLLFSLHDSRAWSCFGVSIRLAAMPDEAAVAT